MGTVLEENRLTAHERGRPRQEMGQKDYRLLMALFGFLGSGIGIRPLQEIFPDASRRVLEEIRQKYREDQPLGIIHALTWTKAGTVWAMDYTRPPVPIEGRFHKILAVRDLASGNVLLFLPVPHENETQTINALKALFVEYGKPLVIKADNGGPVSGKRVKQLLSEHNICILQSPVKTPQYNGAAEAGIGSLKTHAHHESSRWNRPGYWTCNDVEAARRQANVFGCPRGPAGESPKIAWKKRDPVIDQERTEFMDTVKRMKTQVENEQIERLEAGMRAVSCATIDRTAISRALVEHGLLEFRRRSIPLPIKSLFCKKIS